MKFPDFFAEAPTITLRDPLAAFLGASEGGVMSYAYIDVVKLAGHSCPTVAGAYLMVRSGLRHLYDDEIPERGSIEVHMRSPRDKGVTGVMAAVATLITGAAPETGFGGIGANGRFARRDLLHFDAPIDGLLALRRCDNGCGVILDLDMSVVSSAREMQVLFPKAVAGQANEDELARFAALWQAHVEQILVQHADDPDLVRVREWKDAA
ncbi:hypothetical protein [Mesorhizobium sp. A623]